MRDEYLIHKAAFLVSRPVLICSALIEQTGRLRMDRVRPLCALKQTDVALDPAGREREREREMDKYTWRES